MSFAENISMFCTVYVWMYMYAVSTLCTAESGVRTVSIGSDLHSTDFPMAAVRELGLRENEDGLMRGIKINGNWYGGSSSRDLGSITLGTEEYISKVVFICSCYALVSLHFISFCTNLNRCIGSFSPKQENVGVFVNGTFTYGTLKDIRLLAIGGSMSTVLTDTVKSLRLKYISDYQPSQRVDTNVGFILAYSPPFQEMTEYIGSEERKLESYTTVLDVMLKLHYEASVEAEFIAKLSAKLGADFSFQTIHTIKNELETKLEHKVTKIQKIPEGYVGVKIASGDILEGANGTHWVFPSSHISYSIVRLNETDAFLGYYDLTGVFQSQMPGLTKHKTTKHGYVYYDPNKK